VKKLWIIQHQEQTTAGTTLDWAEARGLELHFWRPYEASQPPDVSILLETETAGVVICGGTMDTFEEDVHPWLRTEKRFLRELIEAKVKCFGLCLGAQLLAEILGGNVVLQKDWELGFTTVTENVDDAEATSRSLSVFEWHHCTFEVPPTAELFIVGDYFRNQAFRVGRHVIGTQFHPEATEAWIRHCTERLRPEHSGNIQSKEQILASLVHDRPVLQRWYFNQLDRFFLPTPK
jgi:GMP synthase-like glutamine amidotransferase